MGRALRRTFWAVAAALAVAIAVPFLVPLSHFIPQVARVASDKLGQPVTLEDLRLHIVPTPRVVAHRVRIGRRAQVLIEELEIQPDLLSLVFGPRSVRLVRGSRVVIDPGALVRAAGAKRRPADPLNLRRLVLTTVKLDHPTLDLPLFDVDVKLGERLRLREARIETQDGRAKLDIHPATADAYSLSLGATGWTLPVGPALLFDTLAAHATLKGQALEVRRIDGMLYGGSLAAAAQIEWGKHWKVAGMAQLSRVDLALLQKALGKRAKLSGRLNADVSFSTQAATPADLRKALNVEGPFEVLEGVYQGVDLARAGELNGEGLAGDATTFEELKGLFERRGERTRLSPLCMRSPTLVAGGHVEIAPDRSISGKLDISIAQTGGLLGVPVTLGGTTDEVSMRPSKGYLIGAAIGTALMPGLGTSIGSTLGGRIDGGSGCR